jgi:hypothetical protein
MIFCALPALSAEYGFGGLVIFALCSLCTTALMKVKGRHKAFGERGGDRGNGGADLTVLAAPDEVCLSAAAALIVLFEAVQCHPVWVDFAA